jgi:hypothetical protein
MRYQARNSLFPLSNISSPTWALGSLSKILTRMNGTFDKSVNNCTALTAGDGDNILMLDADFRLAGVASVNARHELFGQPFAAIRSQRIVERRPGA